ncbi:abortive phage resistance protein [Pectobacterium carotovorum subsp. carotovorum]|nr:abortive phage resistance protein [Pectobacterium carotovorum subsp. carotovorum]KML69541.1 abortive phage resistance protein [Pectobacterium carotovorum subsp. carotovorum ICMP 5702]MBL0906799.1 abortive phage resistance protein [Pectobacterium carotovorum]
MKMTIASINDFKLLNTKCMKYFELFKKSNNFAILPKDDKLKERFGFYFFMLEALCNEKDIDKLSDFITDTEYNTYLTNQRTADHGIDAIYIDEDIKEIKLFNFKFRETYKPGQIQSSNEAFVSTKLVNCILNENTQGLQGKLKELVSNSIANLNSNEVWKMTLYMVSNEPVPIDNDETSIQQLKVFYDMEVISVCLPDIKRMMSIRPAPIKAELIVDNEALMSYSESTISTSKSYIVRLNAADIIRITCKNPELRNDYNCERMEVLTNETLDYGVLFDNVRGFVRKSKYNHAIGKSLKDEPTMFFMYNNGMTIVTKNIKAEQVNANKKVRITIDDFQVLNGGQTLRTLHNFNAQNETHITEYLAKSEILVRIFNTTDNEAVNKIAEFTNSQNSISNVDLKSLSTLQIQIEQLLDDHNIIYSRKNGDTGMNDSKDYRYKVSMEQFGQILFAIQGNPDKSSNQKQHIFGKYYDEIFSEDNFNLLDAPNIIENYFEVKKAYDSTSESIQKIEQKIFYILYVKNKLPELSYNECISSLEDALVEFKTDSSSLTDARKMIQVGFKDFLNTKLSIM